MSYLPVNLCNSAHSAQTSTERFMQAMVTIDSSMQHFFRHSNGRTMTSRFAASFYNMKSTNTLKM